MAKTKREIDHDDLSRSDQKYKKLVIPKKPRVPKHKKKHDIPIPMGEPDSKGPVRPGVLKRNIKRGNVDGC